MNTTNTTNATNATSTDTRNATDGPHPRVVNWVALAAGICLLGEILIMSRYKPSLTEPPPISVLLLSLLTLFLGAGSLLYRLNRRQYWFTGRALGVVSMLFGMIIFSVQSLGLHKDREVLLEKQLKLVAAACVTYARGHDGHYPPNLAALLEANLIKPAYLSDPTNVREPLTLPSDWRTIKPKILIHAINANSDFRYVGNDLNLPKNLTPGTPPPAAFSRIIILYSNEQQASTAGELAFADGHIAYVQLGQMPQTLYASNKARKKLGLPPMTFSAGIAKPAAATAK